MMSVWRVLPPFSLLTVLKAMGDTETRPISLGDAVSCSGGVCLSIAPSLEPAAMLPRGSPSRTTGQIAFSFDSMVTESIGAERRLGWSAGLLASGREKNRWMLDDVKA